MGVVLFLEEAYSVEAFSGGSHRVEDHHVLEEAGFPGLWAGNWAFAYLGCRCVGDLGVQEVGPCFGSMGILNAGLPGCVEVGAAQGSVESDYPLELHEVWH